MSKREIFIGDCKANFGKKEIAGELVQIENENYYKISNSDAMRPFFMSIVSDSNHWMFISSNGGLTAGRQNAQSALFPYYTDDKITELSEITGNKTIFLVDVEGKIQLWEPFSDRFKGSYSLQRNLYKNAYGNKVIFEEVNEDLGLTFRYQWSSSDKYGFVKRSRLINNSSKASKVSFVDGIQNILPYGVGSDLQNSVSNLVDAYKKNELETESGLGIFALSAIIVDKAEPSEALKATVAWSLGLENPVHLVSSLQLNNFREGIDIQEETDVRAEKGAYFVHDTLNLAGNAEKEWLIVADVNKNHAAIATIEKAIKEDTGLYDSVNEDIESGTKKLIELVNASDGVQATADTFKDTRHFANTLFNIMRGGIFDNNYQIEKWDFKDYLKKANLNVYKASAKLINELPSEFTHSELKAIAEKTEDKDFKRLAFEYMPLKFSRRHGDPSRPWNKFSINTRNENDGSKILDYEGNWRDIFQNWEVLSRSYPEFIESMIHKFLNATTFDGYNPYRVTKGGFDWETIEPDNPWSYIGYWGDHQIIYLLKFLEFMEEVSPNKLSEYFNEDIFVYANVPYKIKTYQDILKNPKDTIEFDTDLDLKIRDRRHELGADATLLTDKNNELYRVNFIEKILATLLAKISNFIPEAGIWLNTQRPEWNDANNALVGNGVSMVTLYYIRRFLSFMEEILNKSSVEDTMISEDLLVFFNKVKSTLEDHKNLLSGNISDKERKTVLDGLAQAASDYRSKVYTESFSGEKSTVSLSDLKDFVTTTLAFVDHTIKANKREDELYHAYNLMTLENEEEISISYLAEMLEGQVAVLSSGYLNSEEGLKVLNSLKNSKLFRKDQYSYILYPNKQLARFTVKNTIPESAVENSELMQKLIQDGNTQIVQKDVNGETHFNGSFNNKRSLEEALDKLAEEQYSELIEKERSLLLKAFEQVFNHKAFTGRSGTFYGYEGLGSIYWHMVSKLLLAVQETCIRAINEDASPEIVGGLLEHYYEINEGIGVHKDPKLYGAFPTDPYSHTPAGKGAQQPGMTGQVKEDILSRFGELGVFVKNGQLYFHPGLLKKDEFLTEAETFVYETVTSESKEINLEKGSLCYTICQVPVVYKKAPKEGVEVKFNNGSTDQFDSLTLDPATSEKIFKRTGEVDYLTVYLQEEKLR
ncbi:hypothetical protein [Salinimicrobium gaetbulicola]|uniref:Cellobiose phosphorylase n=1 Tax=Salinimicrobium gaetbulicola TaxID=999702 RepID=A0ABW3IGG7_9FLAO